jgi:hypothetical protein
MKFIHHIKIASIMINKMEGKMGETFKLNKTAFYIGNVAPDLNCVYPAHRLKTTHKRVARKIEFVDRLDSAEVIKSFELGIITHYVCDYFCYAHSNETIGKSHKHYEKELYRFFELHKDMFKQGNTDEDIVVEWNDALNIIQEKLNNSDAVDIKSHASMIMEQIGIINKEYMEKSSGFRRDKEWQYDLDQCKRDLEYALFMGENILEMILNPVKYA